MGTLLLLFAPVRARGEEPPAPVPSGLPTIKEFYPRAGPPGTVVLISGENFQDLQSVQFGGVEAHFDPWRDGKFFAYAPTNSPGGLIKVTTAAGSAISGLDFTVLIPSPAVFDFSPDVGPPGSTVQLVGRDLRFASRVLINGIPATFKVMTAAFSVDQLEVTAPNEATRGLITVETPFGNVSTPAPFTIRPSSDQPMLFLERGGTMSPDQMRVTWFGNATDYQLQSAFGFADTLDWIDSTLVPVVSGDPPAVTSSVILTVSQQRSQFFRLVRR
jgi:hypothetical protein